MDHNSRSGPGHRFAGRMIGLGIVLWDMFFLPVVAAAILGFLLVRAGAFERLGPIGWMALAPVGYLAWLILFLLLSALDIRFSLRMFPKPGRLACRLDDPKSLLPLRGIQLCYLRLAMLQTLPLARALQSVEFLQNLVFWSYAPTFRVGESAQVGGSLIYDPDLTEIAPGAILGANSAVVAHALNSDSSGNLTYVSAPISIGQGATVGGEARVGLGVTIGAGAVIEPGSLVAPFTMVPAGEVWGGNPAVFRRRVREASVGPASEPAQARAAVRPEPTDSVQSARRIVAEALNLSLEDVPAELAADGCEAWDSLGQVAIAATLYAHQSLRLSADQVFSLRSVNDIVRLLEHSAAEPPSSIAPAGNDGFLPENPDLLPLLPRETVTRQLAQASRFSTKEMLAPLTVRIAATFTAEPLASALSIWARAFRIPVHVEFLGFNQVDQALLSPDSPFRDRRGGMNVVLVRTEDLPTAREADCRARIRELLAAIAKFAAERPGSLVVATLPPPVSEYVMHDRACLDGMRARWRRKLSRIPSIEIVDFCKVIEDIGIEASRGSDYELIARAPYSPAAYQELGIALARLVRQRRVPPAKVLALDVDGVLWGGVIAEDGLEKIELGPEGHGRAYLAVQRFARDLRQRGVLLALVSRNVEEDVFRVFDDHPEMLLRRDDLAAWRINWRSKAENLRSLAEELGLGLDAFVFVDDDPAQRAEVAATLPEVTVVPLPASPLLFHSTLQKLWAFDGAGATAEDRDRARMMRSERARQAGCATVSRESYLKDLDLQLDFGPARDADLPRIAQLTQKTNQFNLSLRRRDLDAIRNLGADYSIYSVRASDRHGDYGMIGVAILRAARSPAVEIDTFLISCRALGRGIEEAMLHLLLAEALPRAPRVLAPFVAGPRNQPIHDFFTQTGAPLDENACFVFDMTMNVPFPNHIRRCEVQGSGSSLEGKRKPVDAMA